MSHDKDQEIRQMKEVIQHLHATSESAFLLLGMAHAGIKFALDTPMSDVKIKLMEIHIKLEHEINKILATNLYNKPKLQ